MIGLSPTVAAQRDVSLPIAAAATQTMTRMRAGGAILDAWATNGSTRQCWICGQELAAHFHKVEVHPACLYGLGE
jgi:hypothetical protein